jgi:branched-chain amino acid transport system permease protein
MQPDAVQSGKKPLECKVILLCAPSMMNNWVAFTGGPMGLPGIPQPSIFGWVVDSNWDFLLLSSIFVISLLSVCHQVVRSPFGRVLMAIREDEVFALAAGKNIAAYKVLVFVIGAAMASVAGVISAHYISFIDPTSFTVMESILIISIMIIGGAGSFWGPVVGAVVLVTLPEALRFVGMPSSVAANMRQILYGAALVACMMWRPQGLMGKYAFGILPGIRGQKAESGGWKPEDRRRRTEDGVPEDRRLRTEDGGQKSEARRRKTETGEQRPETG